MPIRCGYSLLITLPLLLTGCQVQTLIPESSTCHMSQSALAQVQQTEFSLYHQPGLKAGLLKEARNNRDIALQALLLSQPGATLEQLQQANRLYERLVLYPSADCPGDTYLNLRHRMARSTQTLQQEQALLRKQHQEMQAKINALTELENELTRERETNP